ncbi:hypothetical protein H0E84_05510 [Luteimonas sp. SJ-92]|uniref:Glycosyltransferase family 4 protein n=1 Tax=Luteimonas salinisoli TaxID=2752307 RepID=A0A853J9L1_9GAMM|nr:hypothetical protein [Luteimonas salinisoli]NZA25833.1 hypothetical protein [Luteimonas salinisoli]
MNAIVLGQGNPYLKNPYLSKLARVLEDGGIGYEFWVWSRDGGDTALPRVRVLLRFGSWGGGAVNALGYALWVGLLTLRILLRPRAGTFFCSRLDAALPCALVSLLRRCDYVFLDRDKLSKSHPWPAAAKRVIEWVEGFVGRRALLHVLPGASRESAGDGAGNVRIVRNTPHSAAIALARRAAAANAPRTRLRVLISGLISPERGARMMRAAVERLTGGDEVEFIAAGRLLGADAQALAARLGPGYRGIVGNEDALALLLGADLVLAFYDPALEINRLAEPNKWFDCAALQVPFVTNQGLQTSDPFERAGACFVCPYDDADALVALLRRLAAERGPLERRREGLRALSYEPWDAAMARIVDECAALRRAA